MQISSVAALNGRRGGATARGDYELATITTGVIAGKASRGYAVQVGWAPTLEEAGGWVREGRIKYKKDVSEGLENAPRELIGVLRGENFGKKIIKVGN